MTKVSGSHGILDITQKLCCLGAPGFWMVCPLPPIRMGAVRQPCMGQKGLAAQATGKHDYWNVIGKPWDHYFSVF